MKPIFRSLLINLGAIWITTSLIPAVTVTNGLKGLLLASIVFMFANLLLTPFLKIILLPLNLLTLGIFAWLSNVLTLYILVSFVPVFELEPYYYRGANLSGFIIPPIDLSTFQVAILASFLIAFCIHLLHWLIE